MLIFSYEVIWSINEDEMVRSKLAHHLSKSKFAWLQFPAVSRVTPGLGVIQIAESHGVCIME